MKPIPLVRLDNVSLRLGSNIIFENISFEVSKGEHTALLGPNGSGKSSLLRLIEGDLRPMQDSDSRITWGFGGVEESSVIVTREHCRSVSARQQVNYGRHGWKISGEEIILSGVDNAPMVYGELSSELYNDAVRLAETAGASYLLDMIAPAMSQGQLRMALLLRALMSRPELLLLDEPYDGLDSTARKNFDNALRIAVENGSTIIIACHRTEDIPEFIQRKVYLQSGKLSDNPFADSLNDIPKRTPRTTQVNDIAIPTGQSSEYPILELVNVDCYVNRHKVLHNISWTINSGEQWIVNGDNGSGKSTLLRLLYGEEFAAWKGEYEGLVKWFGTPREILPTLRGKVGYISDRLMESYDHAIPAEEVVISGLRASVGIYSDLTEQEKLIADKWIKLLELEEMRYELFTNLSSGWARRYLLARALAFSPPVLLLDEPFSGLDVKSRTLFTNALPELVRQGVTLIYVSHVQDDVLPVFTHELRLENGLVAYAGKRG